MSVDLGIVSFRLGADLTDLRKSNDELQEFSKRAKIYAQDLEKNITSSFEAAGRSCREFSGDLGRTLRHLRHANNKLHEFSTTSKTHARDLAKNTASAFDEAGRGSREFSGDLGRTLRHLRHANNKLNEFSATAKTHTDDLAKNSISSFDEAGRSSRKFAGDLGRDLLHLRQANTELHEFSNTAKTYAKDLSKDTSRAFDKAGRSSTKFSGILGRNLNKAGNRFKIFGNTARASLNKTNRAASRLAGVIGTIITIEAARRSVMLADSYNMLQQRLLTATRATGDYMRVSKALNEISNRTGTLLATNINLYQSLARVSPELKATTSDMLALTETMGQLGVIGGSNAEQMRNGILQFTQGLAAGIFRAEEYNSIVENLPEVASRIAQGMNLTMGELRKMVIEGKVLSSDVFSSLMNQSKEINQQFKEIAPTISRSSVSLKNSIMTFMGQIDASSGVTEKLAMWIQRAADYLARDFSRQLDNIIELFSRGKDNLNLWAGLIGDIGLNFGLLGKSVFNLIKSVGRLLMELPINLRSLFIIAREKFTSFVVGVNAAISSIGAGFKLMWENIKFAGTKAAGLVQIAWAKVFRRKSMEKNEDLVRIALDKSTKARYEKIASVKDEIQAIAESKRIHQEASDSRIAAAQKERTTAIALLATKSALRKEERAIARISRKDAREAAAERKGNVSEQSGYRRIQINDMKNTLKEKTDVTKIAARVGLDLDKKSGDETLRVQGETFSATISAAAEHSREFFAIKKALALATAMIESPKAILSSYTFGTTIGGPIVGGIFAGLAAAATAVQIAAISSSSFSGRALGGGVSSGQTYRVNERGPEMLSVGGKDFLMMGNNNGHITPNNKLPSGGGGKVIVNVYPQKGETAKVKSKNNGDGTQIDVILEKIEQGLSDGISRGGSTLSEALEKQFGLSRAAGLTT